MTTTQDRTTAATPSAFSLLLTFAKQRPRLDPRNYGDGIKGYRAYQTEARQIGKDLARVKLLAATAIAHGVTDAEIIEASKAAFSGRLEWTGSEWDYCTGQYFPTEYRKAVATVLDAALHARKQAQAENVARPHFTTVADVRAYHEATGSHWFDRSSMRFFGTRILTKGLLIGGQYFITSEQPPHGPRGYTIRQVNIGTGDIKTVGDLCGYRSHESARAAAKRMPFTI